MKSCTEGRLSRLIQIASTVHVQMISDSNLLDVVDDCWREDHLPDDGKVSALRTSCQQLHTLYRGQEEEEEEEEEEKDCFYPSLEATSLAVADIPRPEGEQISGDEAGEEEEALQKSSESEKWKELGLHTVR